jgi:arylsulfatase A-like enzyme
MNNQPNIIILVLDALRAKNLSCYGYHEKTSPNLDAFANEGVLFRRAISPATWTIPSHACFLSGLYISQHRIESINSNRHFHEEIVTLPEALRSQGYYSAAFSQNMLFSPDNHLDDGFDEFHNVDDFLNFRISTRMIQRMSEGSKRPFHEIGRYLRKMISPRVLLNNMYNWITVRKTPFFLFANILSPHFPWTLPPNFLPLKKGVNPKHLFKGDFITLKKQWEFNSHKREVTETHRRVWQTLYDASILHVDHEIDRFLKRFHSWEGWKNTIIVVTSDHGEMMGEYRDIVGHVLSLNNNLIHVPLIIHHPEYPSGLQVEGSVQTLSLYPTVLEWAGVAATAVHPAQLKRSSLSKAIAAPGDPGEFAFAEEDYSDSYDVIEKLIEINPNMNPKERLM